MTTAEMLSPEDKEFLAKCEEEFKDRYTEKDEEFMKVHGIELSAPPIIEMRFGSQNSGRRNDRRFNQPYERSNRDNDRAGYEHDNDSRDRGHSYRGYNRDRPRFNY